MWYCTEAPNIKLSKMNTYLESESSSFTVITFAQVKPYSSIIKT